MTEPEEPFYEPPPAYFAEWPEDKPDRPTVRLDEHERASDVADATLAAIASVNALHRRGGQIVAVRGWSQADAPKKVAVGSDGIERPTIAIREGSPVIDMIRGGALDYVIDREITFIAKRKPKGRPPKDGAPPSERDKVVPCPQRVQSMVAGVGGRQVLSPLESILQVPSMRSDGTIIETPGYDPLTGYYLASRVKLTHLHQSPTIDNARRALKFLQNAFGTADEKGLGFPWRKGLEESIVPIALAMSALVRPATGNNPAFAIDASTPGSGKGKIVGLCSIIATGDEPARAGWPTVPEEQDKTLGGYAVASPPIIAFDNVRGGISNQCLENALTTPFYGFRVLGVHEIMTLPFRSIVTFTGNNLSFTGDLIRRIIIGRLEPQTEHPDRLEPKQFRIPYIEDYVRQHRAQFVSALLTIPRAFVLAGMPDQGLRMGSFDRASGGLGWIELVGGSLAWCGAGDITQYSGKENVEEPEEWGHVRGLLGAWKLFDPNRDGLSLSALLSLLYTSEVAEHIRKGTKGEDGSMDWRPERVEARSSLQALARCPDRAIPDSTKLGNAMRPYVGRWFHVHGREHRFVHALSPATGKPYVPARWKVEER